MQDRIDELTDDVFNADSAAGPVARRELSLPAGPVMMLDVGW